MFNCISDRNGGLVCKDALVSCTLITKRMQGVLKRNGLLMLHRSKWRCLASSYLSEIQELIAMLSSFEPRQQQQRTLCMLADGPLQALEQALQEGEACMHDYIIPTGNHRSWLVDKLALKLVMSTDVVDVHLHHFLWLSSTVCHQLYRNLFLTESREVSKVLARIISLWRIWEDVDATDDLRIAQDLLNKLKGKKGTPTCQLVEFILHKLSHVEAPHNPVTPDSLPPNYMCIDSDQCLHTNTEHLFKTHSTEIRPVVWLGGRFALKSFQPMDCSNPTEMQTFNREAAIQARVCHSHVLPLVCCTNKPPGLLMELMQEDLHALITRRKNLEKDPPFPLLMAVDLMLQIAKGMECLHGDTMRIVHRDLKSHNILVSFPVNSPIGDSNHASSVNPQVHLKIADFGVSKAKHDCSEYTTLDKGTTSWMAPEVYGGKGENDENEPTRYSNKADVYSFGMVCFEILTGDPPFEGVRLGEVRSRVGKGERPKLPPHCPPALSSLIQMCWDAEPSRRPNFTQICIILRYFKACIFLKDCHAHVTETIYRDEWLSIPITSLDFSLDGLDLDYVSTGPDPVGKKIYSYIGKDPIEKRMEPWPLRIPLEMSKLHRKLVENLTNRWNQGLPLF